MYVLILFYLLSICHPAIIQIHIYLKAKVVWMHALHFSLCAIVHVMWCYGVLGCVFPGVKFFFCGMLLCVYVFAFIILSPADYQSILAELQSPATLHSDPHFLESDLPVTPNPSLAQHQQQHHYPEPDTPLLADTQPQPLPWSPELDPSSREAESPPRSPSRPRELTLSVPVFELPDPVPYKARKPHIALNDQLLLSEEEDRSFQEMEPIHRPRSRSFPTMCELDVDMAYSTSSPSLSSVSSITPSSPERAQMGGGRLQLDPLNGLQQDVCLKRGEKEVREELRKVGEVVAAELEEASGFVEKWVERDIIENVQRKCEMITKDRSTIAEENQLSVEQKEGLEEAEKDVMSKQQDHIHDGNQGGAACVIEEVRDLQDLPEEHYGSAGSQRETGKARATTETGSGKVDGDAEDVVHEGDRIDGARGDMQFKDTTLCGSEKDICSTSQGDPADEDQAVGYLSPQAWVEALVEFQPGESGSNEEEKEEDKEMKGEALGASLEEVKNEGGSEEKEENEERTKSRIQGICNQVEHVEQDICSLSGWHSDSSSVNVEPPTPGRSVSSDLLDRRER